MAGVPRSDRLDAARAPSLGARRGGWFSRARVEPPHEDQEAEVREQLYARPDTTQRTVRRVQPMEPETRARWIDPAERADWIDPAERAGQRSWRESPRRADDGERSPAAQRSPSPESALGSDAEIRIERADRTDRTDRTDQAERAAGRPAA